tara:strand:+ start:2511 stop:4256 length:1746 start_codon:yes stop_codon:yes gene_type:complete
MGIYKDEDIKIVKSITITVIDTGRKSEKYPYGPYYEIIRYGDSIIIDKEYITYLSGDGTGGGIEEIKKTQERFAYDNGYMYISESGDKTRYVVENSPAYKDATRLDRGNVIYVTRPRDVKSSPEVKNVSTRTLSTEGEYQIQEVTFEYWDWGAVTGIDKELESFKKADNEGDKLLENNGQNILEPGSAKTNLTRRSFQKIVSQEKNFLGKVKEGTDKNEGYIVTVTRQGKVKSKNANKAIEPTTSPITIIDEYYPPEDPPATIKTPEEVNDETQKETDKKEEQQKTTDVTQTEPEVTIKNTPTELTPKGPSKLSIFLNSKRSEIKRNIIPLLIPLAAQLGIKAVGTLQSKLPDFCLPEYELNRIINSRNQIVNKLNAIVKIIDTFSKILTGFNLIISIITTLVKTLDTSRQTLSALAKTVPNPTIPILPGSVVTGLDDLKEATDKANKKLDKFNGAIAAASVSLAVLNAILLTVISMINSIDICITKCKPDASLLPLSPTLLELEKVNKQIDMGETQQSYKGFSLEIVEEPYSPTVNRRKAVAKNTQGIILLSTPLTFSTENQVLIQEIKLVIDSNNLKAD